MRLLKEEQLEQLLEITRNGNAVQGTVLYKLAHDIKRLRSIMESLVEVRDKNKGKVFGGSFKKEVIQIIEDIEDLL